MKQLIFLMIFLPLMHSPAHAALGGDIAAIDGEGKALHVKASVTPSTHFRTVELAQPKLTIHQFAGSNGKIFAVAWKGQTHPDVAVLMGEHFKDFENALTKAQKTHRGHAPIQVDVDGFHLEMGGHAMAMYGRAWLTNLLPPEVNTRDLQ